ncbi:MAG: hypothetical protein JRN68_03040 [Nitrososphaerota archaeon]|jgi:cobalamin-dependent methionine synthase I|nr:hypothetical protein [Nitrososphaerota archaeon]
MPKQIYDSKTFKSLIPRAEEIRVARSKGKTKLKVRTKGMLYTYVSDDSEAEKLLRNVDKPIVEVNPKTGKAEEKEKGTKEKKEKEKEKEEKEEEPEEAEEAEETEKEEETKQPKRAQRRTKKAPEDSGKEDEEEDGEK